MKTFDVSTVKAVRIYPAHNAAADKECLVVFNDGVELTAESVEFEGVECLVALRCMAEEDLAAFAAGAGAARLPGLDNLWRYGYEFRPEAVAGLRLKRMPLPPVLERKSGPFDDDIRSLEGNEDY